MRVVKNISWFLYKVFAVYSILVFVLVYFTPSSHWIAGFMMMSFPVVILLNLGFLFYALLVKPTQAVLPVCIIALSMVFLPRTYSFNFSSKPEGQPDTGKNFKILNYNVAGFWTPGQKNKDLHEVEMRQMRRWMVKTGADVLCLPEYYSNPGNERVDVNAFFKEAGFKYKSVTDFHSPGERRDYFGLVLLSKYPIVHAKDTSFTETNGIALADIKIGKDTVRVIGVHLFSMTLRLRTLVEQRKLPGLKKESKKVLTSMRKGFSQRGVQIETLMSWIKSSPYPVIVCGDFNEVPYSYVYGKTRDLLSNAFEEKGSGFGFSFNGIPYFIRIDNQFFTPDRLNLTNFATIDSVDYSDNYPLLGTYQVKSKEKN